ncbi:hypothetical protein C2845_PM13G07810 [Panicum miliaceum]|uniref:(DL)-glycerol-3-phosphatase 2 n=1 Tax=Panicum miliaceum TaxID=4540 RepID=A0A3L6RFV8_PANMI|nr:hypothetical protein C2845_PM13G07810 [Panicum miliaceum]
MPSVDATPEAAAPPRAAISHVIFNMDGLLLDTEGFYTAVQEKILARYGKVFDWSVKAKMMGKTTAESTSILFEECGLTGLLTPEEFLKERETMLKELLPTSVAMPGEEDGSLKLLYAWDNSVMVIGHGCRKKSSEKNKHHALQDNKGKRLIF